MTINLIELIQAVPVDSVANAAAKAGAGINWTEVTKIIPSVLWFILIIVVLAIFYKPIRHELIPKLSGFKVMGIEVSLIRKSIDAALKLADQKPTWNANVPKEARNNVLNRAREHSKIFEGAQILWIDDEPENDRNESCIFCQLQAETKFVTTTNEALKIIKKGEFDVIISDIVREGNNDEGIQFLKKFKVMGKKIPVVFYPGNFDPGLGVPSGAFGITNRPDELLHLVMDALERKKY